MICLAMPAFGFAQSSNPYDGNISVTFPDYLMEDGKVTFRADVDYSLLKVSTRQLVELTPVLRSTRTSQEIRFEPILLVGSQRAHMIARSRKYGKNNTKTEPAEVLTVKRKGGQRRTQVAAIVPFEKWMRYSELVLVETCTTCCDTQDSYAGGEKSQSYAMGHPYVFPAPYQPQYAVSYITPEVEPVKTRSDSYTARLSFQAGKSSLLRSFGENASVLAEADRIISELQKDPLLSISGITVNGYASPDGNMGSNQKLSEERARAFVAYLSNAHNLRAGKIRIESRGMGEDWMGLRKALEGASYLEEQQKVLDAIDNIGDIARRKTTIKNIAGGRTYRTMLADLYPPLRRNEYTIAYTVRSFNREEAVQVYHGRPQLLSLNELFMVASTMESGSEAFNNVFDIASRLFPDSPVAQYNRAVTEIGEGLYKSAIRRLENIGENPMALNSLGVAYWHLGEYEKASEHFQKALNAGNTEAEENIKQYNLWFEDKD